MALGDVDRDLHQVLSHQEDAKEAQEALWGFLQPVAAMKSLDAAIRCVPRGKTHDRDSHSKSKFVADSREKGPILRQRCRKCGLAFRSTIRRAACANYLKCNGVTDVIEVLP